MASAVHNVFVGAETGLLKGIDVEKRHWDNLNEVEVVDRQHEITAMCWADEEQKQLCVASRNRTVSIYDTEKQEFTESHHFPGGSGIINGICKVSGQFVTSVESGLVKVWNEEKDASRLKARYIRTSDDQYRPVPPEVHWSVKVELDASTGLSKMRQNKEHPHLVATGGKENDLKIWDLQTQEPIFKAKNVRNDWLNLQVPVWVMDMAFLPGSEKIATVTGHHQLRVYDPSTPQRRPVIDVEFDEYPITSLGLRHGNNQVVIGNTHGKMALMDLRQGKLVQAYKGFAGSIRDIACHPTAPVVVSCSLDRFLRVHHIESRSLLHKFYLKSRLNCLLLSQDWIQNDENVRRSSKKTSKKTDTTSEEADSFWDKLDVVTEKRRKRSQDVSEQYKPSTGTSIEHGLQKGKKMKKEM